MIEASNPNELLDKLIKEEPENSSSIRYAFEFIQVNLSDKTKMRSQDYQNILNHLEEYSNKKTSTRFLNFLPKFQIVAKVMVIIAVGSIIAHYQFSKDPLTQFKICFKKVVA